MKSNLTPILIFDPELIQSSLIEGALRRIGFSNIHKVRNFQSIEPTINEKGIKLLITTDMLTEKETEKITKNLQENKGTKKTPKILFTESKNPTFLRNLISQGINGIIRNPIQINALVQVMRNYLRVNQSKHLSEKVREAQFFKEFTEKEIKLLVKSSFVRHFPAGETIIEKGSPSDHFYILIEGKVEVLLTSSGGENTNFLVEEGTPFGEMAVLTKSPRSAYCIAATDSIVLEVGSQLINDTNDVIRLKIMTNLAYLLAERIGQINKTIENLQLAPKEEEPSPSSAAREVEITPETSPPLTVQPQDDEEQKEGEEEGNEEGKKRKSPFASPTGTVDRYNENITSQEQYDILHRKVNLRSDFIIRKIPSQLSEKICKRFYGYWIGSKLSKFNPHHIWNEKSFTSGSFKLQKALHLVVFCAHGNQAFEECYLQLPLTHRVVGLSQTGCAGTFLGSDSAIDRYLKDKDLEEAIKLDMEVPIERVWKGTEGIEYLTHTSLDIRDESLILVIDDLSGSVTAKVRKRFPRNQMITVIKGVGFQEKEPASIFTYPEDYLRENDLLVPSKEFKGHGFYSGETTFLPDLSYFCEDANALSEWGFVFCTIGILAKVGPDYSGITWGSQGGAEGAVKAAKAMFGVKGAQSPDDLAKAISWADD